MRAKETNFLKLMESQFNQYLVPIYQRTYSWGEKQCQVLWEDILKISKKKSSDRHFIGSVVCYKADEIDLPGQIKKEPPVRRQQIPAAVCRIFLLQKAVLEKGTVPADTSD